MKQLSSTCGVLVEWSTVAVVLLRLLQGHLRWPCVCYDSAHCGLQASRLLPSSRPQQQPRAASLCRFQPHLAMASLQLHSHLHLAMARVPRTASLRLLSPLHLATARVPRVASLQLLLREPVQRQSRPQGLVPASHCLESKLLAAAPSLSDVPSHAVLIHLRSRPHHQFT